MDSIKGINPLYIGAGVLLLVLLAVVGGKGSGASVIRADPNTIAGANASYQASLKASTDLAQTNAGTQAKILDALLGYGSKGLDYQSALFTTQTNGANAANAINANYALGSQQTATARDIGLADVQATREQNGYNYNLGNTALAVQRHLGDNQYNLGIDTNKTSRANVSSTNAANVEMNNTNNATQQSKNQGDIFSNFLGFLVRLFVP